MTRHQRRKLAKARSLVSERKALVRRNLSTPLVRESERGSLVSGIYRGEGGRARGTGVAPMTHKVTAVFTRKPELVRALYPSGTKIIQVR